MSSQPLLDSRPAKRDRGHVPDIDNSAPVHDQRMRSSASQRSDPTGYRTIDTSSRQALTTSSDTFLPKSRTSSSGNPSKPDIGELHPLQEIGEEIDGVHLGLGYGAGAVPALGNAGESIKNEHSRERDSEDDALSQFGTVPVQSPHDVRATDPPDQSRYPQVRAAVSASDDPTLSINTPRMWTLSIFFAILGSATNLFFSLRYPSVSITPIIALLIAHPLGRFWDGIFKRSTDPPESFVNGDRADRHKGVGADGAETHDLGDDDSSSARARKLRPLSKRTRLRRWLGQGRWNQKEHSCVYISSNVSFGFAFATDVIVEQQMFYYQIAPIMYQILLTLSTQILGYAIAGLTRRYLVRPASMIWPATLISTSMFNTLHTEENKPANGWTISRWKFFLFVLLGSFAWYFLPGLLIPAFTYFNVITWFAPSSVVVANLFGVTSGLGMFPVALDWSQIAYIGSPLVVPFWAAMNVVGGLMIVMWLLAPILYYKDVLFGSYMPMVSASVFDNTGKPYDVSKILTPDYLFDREAYESYSRVFLPITYALSYACQFAALTALLSHTACWHGKDIWRQWRQSLQEQKKSGGYQPVPTDPIYDVTQPLNTSQTDLGRRRTDSSQDLESPGAIDDVHNRLMQQYEDVPWTWYVGTGAFMLGIGIFVVEYYPVKLPWYGVLLAFGLCAVLFIPIGIVMAITNQQSSIYLICQLVCGVVFPGTPIGNMIFTTFGYISSTQGMKFSSDLKLGHYMKVPPKVLFKVQMAATIVSSLTQIGVLNWMLNNVPGICTAEATDGFTCPLARVHFNGSILWGVVGPQRFFGPDALYQPLVWAFLIGFIAPIVLWYLARRFKLKALRLVNLPVLLGSLSWIPPATGLNFSVWALVCLAFNRLVRRRKPAWYNKYNFTLAAALDAGLAFGVCFVFFAFSYTGVSARIKWWGTEIYKQGCDWQACPYRRVKDGDTFGPIGW